MSHHNKNKDEDGHGHGNSVKFEHSEASEEGDTVAIMKPKRGDRSHNRMSMDSTSVANFEDAEDDNDLASMARRKLLIAIGLSFTFMICEIIGGVISGSLAIMTDALHLLTDVTGFGISVFAITLSKRPASRKLTFGWYRAEIVGALISVILIWAITAILVLVAIQRIIDYSFEIEAQIMLITSSLGVGINLFMGVQLQHGNDSPGSAEPVPKTDAERGITHGYTPPTYGATASDNNADQNNSNKAISSQVEEEVGEEAAVEQAGTGGTSSQMNVRAALMNMLGDLCQSIGVMVASLIIYFRPEYKIADPICTFLFSILVLVTTVNVMKDVMYIFMEGAPGNINYDGMKADLLKIPGISNVHHVRLWALSTDKIAMAAHVDYTGDRYSTVLRDCRRILRTKYGITDLTLQIELDADFQEQA